MHKTMMIVFPMIKGLVIGGVASFVIASSSFTDFEKALIVAVASATIGAIGVIGSAWVTARMDRSHYEAMIEDLKRAQGLTRRRADPDEDAPADDKVER